MCKCNVTTQITNLRKSRNLPRKENRRGDRAEVKNVVRELASTTKETSSSEQEKEKPVSWAVKSTFSIDSWMVP